MSKFIS